MKFKRVDLLEAGTRRPVSLTLNDMDNHDDDIESILTDNDTFCRLPTIAYSVSLEEIVEFAQEHEKSGTPYAITGLPLGDGDHARSPLLQSPEWLESIYHLRSELFISVCAVTLVNPAEHSKQTAGHPH